MDSNNGALSFDAYINNTDFKKQIDEMERRIIGLTDSAVDQADKMDSAFKKVGMAIGAYFSFQSLKGFGAEILKVRGEFEDLEVSFNTMLGSKEKANDLMAQIVDVAARTPYNLTEVASGAKQLLAYGEASENVTSTLTKLGNIASGINAPLNDIVYLYGTTMTQGRLYTQDLNQFTGRGIPMIKELAKQFNVAESDVKGLVEAGKVGFPEVEKVIDSLTGSGGMFYNLMENKSKTLNGQIANLEDSWDKMLNEIGKQSEGVATGTIEVLGNLVSNYDKVLDILKILVATYGAYKAAVIAVNVAKTISIATTAGLTAAETLHYGALVVAEKAQSLLNKTMLANPYVLAATLLVGVITSVALFSSGASAAEKAQDSLNEAMGRAEETLTSERAKIETLTTVIKSETASRRDKEKALKDLIDLNPDMLSGLTEEAIRTGTATAAIDKYIESRRKQIQLDEINRELDASLKRENDAKAGKNDIGWFKKAIIRIGSAESTQSGNYTNANDLIAEDNKRKNLEALNDEKVIQANLKKKIDEIMKDNSKSTAKETVRNYQTVGDKVDEITRKISKLEKERTNLNASDAKGLNKINKEIAALDKQKNALEGKGSSGSKSKKEKTPVKDSLDYWEKIKEDATKSLNSLSTKDASFATKQANLLGKIKTAEDHISAIERGQMNFNEQLDYKKKQYELYYKWVEQIGKKAADEQFASLISGGQSYVDYLNNEIAKLEAKKSAGTLTKGDANNLISLNEQKDDATGVKSPIESFKEELAKAKEEAGSLIEYLDILKKKKEALASDNSETGIAKKAELQTEENSTTGAIKDNVKQLVDNYQSYAGKVRSIEKSLTDDLKTLYKGLINAKTDEEKKQIQEAIEARTKAAKDETNKVKASTFEESDAYKTLAEFMQGQSRKMLVSRLKDIEKSLKAAKAAYGEDSKEYKKLVKDINNAKIKAVSDDLKDVSNILQGASELAGQFDSELGDALSTAASMADAAADIGMSVAQFASGDILGGIQSAISGISKIVTLAKSVKEENAKARAEVKKFNDEVYLGGIKYNQLLRERLDLEQQIGETSLDYYKRKQEAIAKEKADIQKEYDELFAKIQGEDYIDSKGYKHGTLFRKAKTWNNMASLSGKSYEDIEKLYEEGRLEDDVKTMFEQLKELKDEGADVADLWLESIEAMKEAFTGTTYDSLVDSILSAFESGKIGAEDLASTFGDLMKKSLLETFKMQYLEEPLRNWYNQFAEYAQSGNSLSKDEIEALRSYYNSIMQTANDQYEAMKEASGLDWTATSTDPLTGSVQSLTEETGSAVAGQVTMLRITTSEHLDVARKQLEQIAIIAYNTGFCSNLVKLDRIVQLLEGSAGDSLRAKGLA